MRLTGTEIDTLRSARTVHRNPVQRDQVVVLRTSKETGGEYTLMHLEAEPGATLMRHYHRSFDERFDVLDGTLTVEVEGRTHILHARDGVTVPVNTLHRWTNTGSGPARILIELSPGNPGFEKALAILYGLADDGRVMKNAVPRNFYHTALLMEWSDTWLPGPVRLLEPLARRAAARARRKGMDRQLEERYCR